MGNVTEQALNYLSRRALTSYELKKRLLDKGFSQEEVLAAVERLEEWGYLNDRHYALAYCNSHRERHSRRKIREDLRWRGLDLTLIEQVLAEVYSPEDELSTCISLAEKAWREVKRQKSKNSDQGPELTPPLFKAQQQKVVRKLLQKGYPTPLVYEVIKKISGQQFDEIDNE